MRVAKWESGDRICRYLPKMYVELLEAYEDAAGGDGAKFVLMARGEEHTDNEEKIKNDFR
jgi:hypothetical protein